jgi:hypothetical protein
MKLLLDNILSTATLTSLHEDPNNPLENLYHVFLRNRYQSTATSDTITITFASPTSINSIYYGYTNASTISFQFLDASGNEMLEFGESVGLLTEAGGRLLTELGGGIAAYSNSDIALEIESFHFDAISVSSIKIALSGSANVYLGGVGVGTTYAPPYPSDNWTEPLDDRSIVSESQAGQILQEYVQPLRIYNFTFEALTRAELNTLRQTYIDLGRGKPLWIEIVPDHTDVAPLYGYIQETPDTTHARFLLSLTFKFKEAR